MPLKVKGGSLNSNRNTNVKQVKFLTEDQAKFVCDKVSARREITTKTIQQEMNLTETNAYRNAMLDDVNKKRDSTQIKEWSILSDHVKYVMHGDSEAFHKLNIDLMKYRQNKDLYKELKKEEMLKISINFGGSPEKLKSDYLDVYEGVYAEVISTDRFDEDTNLSTTYLGQVDMTRSTGVKAGESFPITARGYTKGQLLDGTDCEVLIDTGASKSYMSKCYFLQCKNLHTMPKFTSSTRRIQVGNGEYVGVLFVIPVIITIQKHRFEIFTLVSEIHENADLVLGIKNLFELEGVIDSRNSCLSFLNRSIPFFSREKDKVKPKEQKLIVLEAPFVEEITGMAITKLLDMIEQMTLNMKITFIRNRATFKVTNGTHETVTFDPTQMLGIIDLRYLGYYKIKQGVLQQNLSNMYHFESANEVCAQFNKLINTLQEEEKMEGTEKYPWLDDSKERKYMTDKEILDRYIDLENSCLTKREKKEVRNLIYKYKDAFSLRHKIGTCPNIEVDIDVTHKSPFFIRPFHAREEDKAILDKEMTRLCYLGILKEGFSAYPSPIMLVSRKVTQDQRVMTDFRHLNVRIAKNNLAYPLIKDMFTLLGNL